jgi:hypothetical protein
MSKVWAVIAADDHESIRFLSLRETEAEAKIDFAKIVLTWPDRPGDDVFVGWMKFGGPGTPDDWEDWTVVKGFSWSHSYLKAPWVDNETKDRMRSFLAEVGVTC